MRRYFSLVCFLAVAAMLFSAYIGNNGYRKIIEIKEGIEKQSAVNKELEKKIKNTRSEIISVLNDKRALEKAVREELFLTKEDETIVIFN
ncbi:MAG: septum formation initiator family protein [Candidatus Dadabacteria bacterium]|nr:MAG: septum formation initiator family protein [Candidatus Dadabacteria bacterium]